MRRENIETRVETYSLHMLGKEDYMNIWEVYDVITQKLEENLFTIPPYPIISRGKVKELLDALENPDCPLQKVYPNIKRALIHKFIIKIVRKNQKNIKVRFRKLELY